MAQQEKEIVIQEEAPGAGPGGISNFLAYIPAITEFIAGVVTTGKISFVVRALGKRRRVTIEDA